VRLRNTGSVANDLAAESPVDAAGSPVELTRRSFAAAGSGDYDLMLTFYGPDSTFDMSDWGLGVHSGEASIRTFFEAWIGAFEEFDMTLEEIRDLGGGVVFAIARQSARPPRSRSFLELRHAAIAVWEDGVALRVTNYRDTDHASRLADMIAEAVE
jgi:ketosteroid isomerase-like protein